MATAFQQSAFQCTPNKAFQIDAEAVARSGGGGIDQGQRLKRRKTLHLPVKPTGLLDRPKAKDLGVQKRLDEAGVIQAEIAGRLAKEFSEETAEIAAEIETRPVIEMTMAEGEDEIMLLLLMVAASV